MPSAIPGMDPFLENQEQFPTLHHDLITYIKEALQPKLPEPYFAKTNQRVWVEVSQRFIEPDVTVVRRPRSSPRPEFAEADAGGVAVATLVETDVAEPLVVETEAIPNDEHEESYIEIYSRQDGTKRLVTSIEVLSPANKSSAGQGRELYCRKQEEILRSPVHLVEIDLLRSGKHKTAVRREFLVAKAGEFDYHICLHRFDAPTKYFLHPIKLFQKLPKIAIPLLPGHGAVALDLQAVFDRCYDAGAYRREIDYARDQPDPPLNEEQTARVRQLLAPPPAVPPAPVASPAVLPPTSP